MSSKAKPSQPTVKPYPTLKTIITKENDAASVSTDDRPGVWTRTLDRDIVLKDGDTVTLKNSYVKNSDQTSGFITVSADEMADLSITTGMYYTDAGCGESLFTDLPTTNWDPDTLVQPPLNAMRQTANGAARASGAFTAIPGGGMTRSSVVKNPENAPNGDKYVLCDKVDDVAQLQLELRTASALGGTAMTITMKGNPNYRPHEAPSASNEFYDYTIHIPGVTHFQPPANPSNLDNVRYLIGMKLSPVVLTQGQAEPKWLVYSAVYPNPPPGVKPGIDDHIATAEVSTDAAGVGIWKFVPNPLWKVKAGNPETVLDSWVFPPAVADTPIVFGYTTGAGLYRVCVGFWLWGVFPGKRLNGVPERDKTFPVVAKNGQTNNYGFSLNYYGRGTQGKSVRKNHKISFPSAGYKALSEPWAIQMQPYTDDFASFATGKHGPQPADNPAPLSVFPAYTERATGFAAPYPKTGSGFQLTPVWFSANVNELQATNVKVFEPFTYDATPQLTHTDGSAAGYAPFDIGAIGPTWRSGNSSAWKGYETSGFIPQNSNGQVQYGKNDGQEPPGFQQFQDQMQEPPGGYADFKFNDRQVTSLPYIPGTSVQLTPRTYTTKLLEVPGCTLPTIGGTFTYSEWAKLLTDNLNRMPKVIGGMTNNPADITQRINTPTYSQSRLLTDTVQLCYQGESFPNTNSGLPLVGLNYQSVPADPTAPNQSLYRQPYWVRTDGTEMFQFNNDIVTPGQATTTPPVKTPTPTLTTPSVTLKIPSMGSSGARWCGAEAVSFDFNEEASAFEVLQLHSNLYDAASGAIVTRQYRSNPPAEDPADITNVFGAFPSDIGGCATVSQQGGVFLTDFTPVSVWETKMNLNVNMLVSTDINSQLVNLSKGDWAAIGTAIGFDQTTTDVVNLVEGVHTTGNYIGVTAGINKAPNTATDGTGTTGGRYNNINVGWNTVSQVSTPVTIPGHPIISTELKSPFYQVEISGIGKSDIYGQDIPNALIAGVVGRYYVEGGYTESSGEGAIQYVHRGRPLLLRQLQIRILDAEGREFSASDDVIGDESAVILEINSSIDSVEYTDTPMTAEQSAAVSEAVSTPD